MKRPVTSLCRRPGKKDRLRGSLSPMREQFPPTGTLYGGQAELPGKSCPDEGSKTVPGEGQELCADCAHGGTAGIMCGVVSGKYRTGRTPGQRACPGTKTASGEGRGLCAGCAHGGMAGNGGVWCREGAALGARRGRGHARAQKQPPAGAGGCLDAGYECYLPRAIRVIWMHRVGSTARPRIMPS